MKCFSVTEFIGAQDATGRPLPPVTPRSPQCADADPIQPSPIRTLNRSTAERRTAGPQTDISRRRTDDVHRLNAEPPGGLFTAVPGVGLLVRGVSSRARCREPIGARDFDRELCDTIALQPPRYRPCLGRGGADARLPARPSARARHYLPALDGDAGADRGVDRVRRWHVKPVRRASDPGQPQHEGDVLRQQRDDGLPLPHELDPDPRTLLRRQRDHRAHHRSSPPGPARARRGRARDLQRPGQPAQPGLPAHRLRLPVRRIQRHRSVDREAVRLQQRPLHQRHPLALL